MDDDGAMSSYCVIKIDNVLPGMISYANGSLDNLVKGDTLNLSSDGTTDSDWTF